VFDGDLHDRPTGLPQDRRRRARRDAHHLNESAMPAPAGPRVVVVGGGFGGNFTAVTLRKLAPAAEIVVEGNPFFISGPASMEYVFGMTTLDEISRGYRPLMGKTVGRC
jgi:hypothetical protein